MISQLMTATKFALLAFRRNPAATFFTVVMPLLFLVAFGFIFGDQVTDDGPKVINFMVPGIIGLSIVSATFVNMGITTTFKRELGQLKRIRATPMPPVVYVLSQALAAVCIAIVMTIVVAVVGRVIFGVSPQWDHLPILVISVLLGSAAMAALGLAVTAIIPSQDAAPAVTNFIVLPLYFFSDVFIIGGDPPALIRWIGNIFPIKHLVRSMQDGFNPFVEGVTWPWGHWAVLGVWGVIGVVAASLFFRWTPARSN